MNGVHRGLIECKKHLDPQHSDMDREIFDIIDRFVNKILSEGLETGILKMNAVLSEYIKVLRSKDGSLLGARTDLTLCLHKIHSPDCRKSDQKNNFRKLCPFVSAIRK